MDDFLVVVIKLLLSAALGALIGFEREHSNRPAGLRTNTLVCIGAALVQITSIDIFNRYSGQTNIDPARLGAQVISGIGFLGAGTIIREGTNIKGLTTAAGLWVVACIGIAIGSGSYAAGIMGAVLAYIILRSMRVVEYKMANRSKYLELDLEIANKPGEIGRIGKYLGEKNISIRNMVFKEYEDDDERVNLYLSIKLPTKLMKQEVIGNLLDEEGVYSVEEL